MLVSMLQSIINGFSDILSVVSSILPPSPFNLINQLTVDNEMLSALAWLVPFPQIIALLEAWGVAVGAYYIYMVVLRWVKLLG